MKYTVKGSIGEEEPREITWEDGNLSGDIVAVKFLQAMAEAAEGYPVGPICGPYTVADHLKDPLSTLMLIQGDVFRNVADISGDIPEVPGPPEVPEGAIV